MKIWKIASRWSDTGRPETTILDVFIKNGVAFIYPEEHDLSGICVDDIIAISDGQKIVAVAKATSKAQKVSMMSGVHLSQRDQEKIDWCYRQIEGVKIRFYPSTLLQSGSFVPYHPYKRFCQIHEAGIKEAVISIWAQAESSAQRNPFQIEARTSTLRELLSDDKTSLYMIPIFQRPYSWGEREVERFLGDALTSYRKQETMFIGTMQLSGKRILSTRGQSFREVVDGQQRLTTCALILKSLLILLPNHCDLEELAKSFDWLETKVSGGEQQKALDAALHAKSFDPSTDTALNRFVNNGRQIFNILTAASDERGAYDEDGGSGCVDLVAFAQFFLTQLHIVVIETEAGLSKTIQIFNIINSTGLDLNGGDLFKVRCFEYLTELHGRPDTCFDDISALYEKIERTNSTTHRVVTSIQEVLGIYQKAIIARNGLSISLCRASTESFYERLFDSLLQMKTWDGFTRVASLDRDTSLPRLIDLDDLDQLLTCRLKFDDDWRSPNKLSRETRLAYHLIEWSRYESYWTLTFLIDFCYAEEINADSHLKDEFVQALARLCVVYSIINARQVNEMHNFLANLSRQMFVTDKPKSSLAEITSKVRAKYATSKAQFGSELCGNLANYATAKHLVCRLLEAMKSEGIDELERIFSTGYDVEHIQSYHAEDPSQRDNVWRQWGVLINSVGNLMLLEYDLNRSIKNARFVSKKPHYAKSRCRVAKSLAVTVEDEWTTDLAKGKRDDDCKALIEHVFGN